MLSPCFPWLINSPDAAPKHARPRVLRVPIISQRPNSRSGIKRFSRQHSSRRKLVREICRGSAPLEDERWSATQAYKYLVRDQLISRQVAIDALHVHFQDCVKNEDVDMLAPLACALGDLAAELALPVISVGSSRSVDVLRAQCDPLPQLLLEF